MKLINMKMSKGEQDEKNQPMLAQSEYPYGLCINLDTPALEKLGLKLPKLGDSLDLVAKVKVTAASMSDSEYGQNKSLSLQITDLAVKSPKSSDKEISEKLYGDK